MIIISGHLSRTVGFLAPKTQLYNHFLRVFNLFFPHTAGNAYCSTPTSVEIIHSTGNDIVLQNWDAARGLEYIQTRQGTFWIYKDSTPPMLH